MARLALQVECSFLCSYTGTGKYRYIQLLYKQLFVKINLLVAKFVQYAV